MCTKRRILQSSSTFLGAGPELLLEKRGALGAFGVTTPDLNGLRGTTHIHRHRSAWSYCMHMQNTVLRRSHDSVRVAVAAKSKMQGKSSRHTR
jgi:hypothetical protein